MEEVLALPKHPFTRATLRELGMSDWRIRQLLASGVIRRVIHGVYARADLDDTMELRIEAIATVVDPRHVVVDRTAAWIHGVDVLLFAEHEFVPPVETCALRGRHPTERAAADGRRRDLVPDDITVVGGVRVTTPLRTAMDLGCNLRRRDAMAALIAIAREHGITPAQIRQRLPRFRRRRGVVQLRELIDLIDPRIESAREAWVWLAIHDAGLPEPEPQVWIDVGGVPTYRLDFAYRRSRVCVEYNGVDFHDMTDEQRRSDKERHDWLRAHGWTVVVVRLGDFTGDGLDRWLRELREALRPTYSNRRW